MFPGKETKTKAQRFHCQYMSKRHMDIASKNESFFAKWKDSFKKYFDKCYTDDPISKETIDELEQKRLLYKNEYQKQAERVEALGAYDKACKEVDELEYKKRINSEVDKLLQKDHSLLSQIIGRK